MIFAYVQRGLKSPVRLYQSLKTFEIVAIFERYQSYCQLTHAFKSLLKLLAAAKIFFFC